MIGRSYKGEPFTDVITEGQSLSIILLDSEYYRYRYKLPSEFYFVHDTIYEMFIRE